MAGIVFACRLLLALVFAVAGIAKLADREGARAVAAEFGLGWRLAGPVSFVVPVLELGVAVALLPGVSAPWAAAAAAGLLVAFVLAIGVNLARGRRPDCHCFGQLHSAPAGPAALGRNVVLGAVAGLVAVAGFRDPGPSAVGWLSGVGAVVIAGFAVGAVVVALLGWLAYALLRQQGRLLIRLDTLEATLAAHGIEVPSAGELEEPGLAVGTPAPAFALPSLDGERTDLDALLDLGVPVLLVFSDADCGPCQALLADIGRWQREHAADLSVAVISRRASEEQRARAAEHRVARVLLEEHNDVFSAYGATATPAAVLVSADGRIASPLAQGSAEIHELVAGAVGAVPLPIVEMAGANGNGSSPTGGPAAPRVGERAPETRLVDLDGGKVELTELRGSECALLFFNPACGFCRAMVDDLRALEAAPPAGMPRLVVVSTGGREVNRELGLRSLVLDDGLAAQAFGVAGTPMAIRLDAEGRITSQLAAGADAVLTLLRGERRVAGPSVAGEPRG